MKFFVLALFVAAATAAPSPLDDDGGPVELIVNGVPEGEPLEIGDLLDIKVKEHVNGQLASATNILHPLTAVGLAEAAAAAAAAAESDPVFVPEAVVIPEPVFLPPPVAPEVIIPEPVVLPSPVAPEVIIPEPVVLPSPVAPEVVIPEPVVLPPPVAPEVVIPEPVVLPPLVAPEVVIPEPVVLPPPVAPEVAFPEAIPNGEIYNDGIVQVTLNTPQEAGVFSTIQSWFNMVLNYFSDGVQTSHQII